MTKKTNDDTTPAPRRTIPIDGALAALRDRMSTLGQGMSGNTCAPEYVDAVAAVECLAEAISQAQAAERAAHPLHVVTTDPSLEARAKAVDASRPRDEDPEFARVHMTPVGKLRAIAGLVKLLPAGDYPSLWLGTREAYQLAASLPGARLRATPAQQSGMVIHSAFVDVDGLEVRAHYLVPGDPPAIVTSREPVSP